MSAEVQERPAGTPKRLGERARALRDNASGFRYAGSTHLSFYENEDIAVQIDSYCLERGLLRSEGLRQLVRRGLNEVTRSRKSRPRGGDGAAAD